MPKLTERQVRLLREAAEYAISDHGDTFYRLGGHGDVQIRYSRLSFPALERIGLAHRRLGYWKTTEEGRRAIAEFDRVQADAADQRRE